MRLRILENRKTLFSGDNQSELDVAVFIGSLRRSSNYLFDKLLDTTLVTIAVSDGRSRPVIIVYTRDRKFSFDVDNKQITRSYCGDETKTNMTLDQWSTCKIFWMSFKRLFPRIKSIDTSILLLGKELNEQQMQYTEELVD